MPEPELAQRLELARSAVRDAGALAMEFFNADVKNWDKGDNDPVSEADLAVDALLKERLLNGGPGDGWLSEESASVDGALENEHIWVVDPIDGTRAFIDGKPQFTVSVALVHEGEVQLGLVFNPATDEFFEACAGEGALCNGAAIAVSSHDKLTGCRMIGYRDMYAPRHWRRPWPEIEIAMVNSIAYRLALVAKGEHDACVNLKPQNDWDIAAADLILREAGGVCTNRQGAPYRFHGQGAKNQNVIAANPVLQRKLVYKLDEFEPKIPKNTKTPGN